MATKGSFIIVGENIHCTRIRLVKGKFVETTPDGSSALLFKEGKTTARLPIPASVLESDNWKSGKVPHVAVAVRQGLYGTGDDQEAGARYLQAMARDQEAAGAWFLDLNVDEFSTDREEKVRAMEWAAGVVQQASTIPLSIDSSDQEILEAGLKACDPARGAPMVNSVSLERTDLIPVAARAKACIIAGASGAETMPESVDDRLDNMAELMEKLQSAGFSTGEIFLDPLVYPASVDVHNAVMLIDAIRALREAWGPDIHFAPGLSNISYGFPRRAVINKAFARLCRDAGCDGGIVDPMQINDSILNSIDFETKEYRLARNLLEGRDEFGMEFISAMRG